MDTWVLKFIVIPGRGATLIHTILNMKSFWQILTQTDATVFVWVWKLKRSLDPEMANDVRLKTNGIMSLKLFYFRLFDSKLEPFF